MYLTEIYDTQAETQQQYFRVHVFIPFGLRDNLFSFPFILKLFCLHLYWLSVFGRNQNFKNYQIFSSNDWQLTDRENKMHIHSSHPFVCAVLLNINWSYLRFYCTYTLPYHCTTSFVNVNLLSKTAEIRNLWS